MAEINVDEIAMEIANKVLDIVLDQMKFRRDLIQHCHNQIDDISAHWQNYSSPSEAKKGYKDILSLLEEQDHGELSRRLRM